jgi:hypothetical protein
MRCETLQQAADLLRVPKRLVSQARRVLEDCHPEIIDAVDSGKMKLHAAATLAVVRYM